MICLFLIHVDSIQYRLALHPYWRWCDPKGFRRNPENLFLRLGRKRPGRFLFCATRAHSPARTGKTGASTIMGAVTLDYAAPDEALRGHLSVFYEFRADVERFEDVERADLAQFRFLLTGANPVYHFSDGQTQHASAITIVGPSTGPTRVSVDGPVHIFGVGLLPAGWGNLLDFEASLLVNRVIDATELFGAQLHEVAQALRDAPTLDDKVAIGNALARRLIGRSETPAFAFTRLVDDWLGASPSPIVDDLVAASGLSRRQVERNCKRFYGSPPKVLARKYRALRAAIAIARGETSDFEAAGFYDQSHFIREIKQFTGVTPGKIMDDLPTLARLTLKRSELVTLGPLVTRT
jgi:AraC-like DNA-binding protein